MVIFKQTLEIGPQLPSWEALHLSDTERQRVCDFSHDIADPPMTNGLEGDEYLIGMLDGTLSRLQDEDGSEGRRLVKLTIASALENPDDGDRLFTEAVDGLAAGEIAVLERIMASSELRVQAGFDHDKFIKASVEKIDSSIDQNHVNQSSALHSRMLALGIGFTRRTVYARALIDRMEMI